MRDVDLAEGKTGNVGRHRVHDEIVIIVLCAKHFCMFSHIPSNHPHFANKESEA